MDEALMKRVLPHSVEAEQSVIGAMLMDKEAVIAASEIINLLNDQLYTPGCSVTSKVLPVTFIPRESCPAYIPPADCTG